MSTAVIDVSGTLLDMKSNDDLLSLDDETYSGNESDYKSIVSSVDEQSHNLVGIMKPSFSSSSSSLSQSSEIVDSNEILKQFTRNRYSGNESVDNTTQGSKNSYKVSSHDQSSYSLESLDKNPRHPLPSFSGTKSTTNNTRTSLDGAKYRAPRSPRSPRSPPSQVINALPCVKEENDNKIAMPKISGIGKDIAWAHQISRFIHKPTAEEYKKRSKLNSQSGRAPLSVLREQSYFTSISQMTNPEMNSSLLTESTDTQSTKSSTSSNLGNLTNNSSLISARQRPLFFKIFVLVVQPMTKTFEIISIDYSPKTTIIADIINLIPTNCSDPSLGYHTYVGFSRPRKGSQRTQILTDFSMKASGTDRDGTCARILCGEILVAIPEGYTGKICQRIAKVILKSPTIARLLQKADPLKLTSKPFHLANAKPSTPEPRLDSSETCESPRQMDVPRVSHNMTTTDNNKNTTSIANTTTDTPISKPKGKKRLDQYGFIKNMDSQGLLCDDTAQSVRGGAAAPPNDALAATAYSTNKLLLDSNSKATTSVEIRLQERLMKSRTKKWGVMFNNWPAIQASSLKWAKVRGRARKGIPNSIRGEAWANITKAAQRVKETEVGVYNKLVRKSYEGNGGDRAVDGDDVNTPTMDTVAATQDAEASKDTIERDINRTFPRHSMFYDSASDSESEEGSTGTSYDHISDSDSIISMGCRGGRARSSTPGDFKTDGQVVFDSDDDTTNTPNPVTSNIDKSKYAKGGQASLRRVLRAYSIYDQEVGYCQGMNFIAAMFITYVPEEQAFWLLVATMKDSPCQMHSLFSRSMSGIHQVLFVAQKLITQFLPQLAHHLECEYVDITMFATQWLLTMYVSSFPFDVATRIWDCFLVEGWKVAYRVMLALLDGACDDLLKLKFEEILSYLKHLPHRVDHHKLLEAAFKIPLKKTHLVKYAKQWEKKEKKRMEMERDAMA